MQEFFSTFVHVIPTTVAQALILSLVALAVMLPFRLLGFADLTSEGAFPLGGCVAAVCATAGMNPWLVLAAGTMAGALAGACTAYLHLRFRIHTLLAGILLVTMLYSINLRVMGSSNVSVFGLPSVYPDDGDVLGVISVAGLVVGVLAAVLTWSLTTEHGLAFRTVGVNPEMAEAQGISVWKSTVVGVAVAGGLAALSGALMVQSQGFADVNMGMGILINGLAALMIGEAIIGRRTVLRQLMAPLIGSLVYYLLVSACLAVGMPPPDLKLATGVFVLTMLALPTLLKKRRSNAPMERDKVRD